LPPASQRFDGEAWLRDGCGPNRAGWRGGDESLRLRRLSLSREEETRRKGGDSGSLESPVTRSGHDNCGVHSGGHRGCVDGVLREKRPLPRTRGRMEKKKQSERRQLLLGGRLAVVSVVDTSSGRPCGGAMKRRRSSGW